MLGTEFANAGRRALETLGNERYAESIRRARTDPNFFCEWCFRDDQANRNLMQAWHHRQWQELTGKHKRLAMWFPLEHGKTTQAKMTLCRLLGKHPDRQYAYISAKAQQARKVLAAIKREIETNAYLRMVYPELRPQRSNITKGREEWGNTRIRVEGCPPGAKDPSLSAYGLDGQILGSRLHGVVLDNVLDKANTRSDTLRDWVREVIEDEIIGRVLETGFIWIIDTAWYADDALHVFAKRPGWHAVKFDAEEGIIPGETLWPQQWPRERLDARRLEIGQTAYDRQYRNMPLSDSMSFFKETYWNEAYGRCAWLDAYSEPPANVELRTGVDLATKKGEEHDLTAFATIERSGGRRRLINLQSGRFEGMEILQRIAAIYRAFHGPVNRNGGNALFVVEDNAAQVYIVQLMRNAAICQAVGLTRAEAADIRIIGRTTTSKRRDPELGVQGLATHIEMGRWDFPVHNEIRELRDEMRVWTPNADHYGDRLMALWIADASMQAIQSMRVDII